MRVYYLLRAAQLLLTLLAIYHVLASTSLCQRRQLTQTESPAMVGIRESVCDKELL